MVLITQKAKGPRLWAVKNWDKHFAADYPVRACAAGGKAMPLRPCVCVCVCVCVRACARACVW